MIKLVIPGPLPGLNEYIEANRQNRQKGAAMKRQTEQTIILCAKSQLRGVRFTRAVRMNYLWVERNRRRDKDNVAFAKKFVQDALVKVGVLRGDGWAGVDGFSDAFDVDKQRPRVEIIIEEGSK